MNFIISNVMEKHLRGIKKLNLQSAEMKPYTYLVEENVHCMVLISMPFKDKTC